MGVWSREFDLKINKIIKKKGIQVRLTCVSQSDSSSAVLGPSLHSQKIARAKWEFLFGTTTDPVSSEQEKSECAVLLFFSYWSLHPSSFKSLQKRTKEEVENYFQDGE